MENTAHKIEHIWNAEDGRWIYLEKNEQMKIIGMNFMQGYNHKYFKDFRCTNNPALLKFYEQMFYTFPIEEKSVNTMEFISKCILAYHSAVSLNEKYN